MMQLMNLPASFEPNRGSGRRWVLLAVNLRAMRLSPSQRGRRAACSLGDDELGDRRRHATPSPSYFFLAPAAAAAFLRCAPYLERACLRSATPWQSSTPRTMW